MMELMRRLMERTAAFRAAMWGCVVLLAVLSLLPADEMVRTGLSNLIEHAVAYAGTALLAGLGYRERGPGWIGAALVAYAGALELLQDFSPGRHSAVGDWLASSAGALLGVWVAHFAPVFAPRSASVARRPGDAGDAR
ncbi:MAG: VanZ family protein [Acetobacteraceae bacterium]|nr:VanZ family protein [Acetobacteraceae bacterium]